MTSVVDSVLGSAMGLREGSALGIGMGFREGSFVDSGEGSAFVSVWLSCSGLLLPGTCVSSLSTMSEEGMTPNCLLSVSMSTISDLGMSVVMTQSNALGIITAFLLLCLGRVSVMMISCLMDLVVGSACCLLHLPEMDCIYAAVVVGLCTHLHCAATLLPQANGAPIPVHSSTHAPLVQYCLDSLLSFEEGLREGVIAHF